MESWTSEENLFLVEWQIDSRLRAKPNLTPHAQEADFSALRPLIQARAASSAPQPAVPRGDRVENLCPQEWKVGLRLSYAEPNLTPRGQEANYALLPHIQTRAASPAPQLAVSQSARLRAPPLEPFVHPVELPGLSLRDLRRRLNAAFCSVKMLVSVLNMRGVHSYRPRSRRRLV